jgi:hypothetical protein
MKNYSDIKSTGPWIAESDPYPLIKDGNTWWKVYSVADERAMIAEIGRTAEPTAENIEEDAANAHLIAAAPDLLKMLIALREYVLSEIPAGPGTFIEALINCTNDTIALAFGDETSDWFKEARAMEAEVQANAKH